MGEGETRRPRITVDGSFAVGLTRRIGALAGFRADVAAGAYPAAGETAAMDEDELSRVRSMLRD